jgi:hypothetical protein
MGERQERGDSTFFRHPCDRLSSGGGSVARQDLQPAWGQARELHTTGAERPYLIESVQRIHERWRTRPHRRGPQPIQRCLASTRGHHKQAFQSLPNFSIRQLGQAVPEPLRRAVADAGHESRERGHARQQDLALDEARSGQVEQDAWPLGAEPRARVQPLDQPKVLRLLVEVAVAEMLADLGSVVPAGVADAVRLQVSRRGQVELGSDVGNDAGGDVRRIGQKRAQKSGGDALSDETPGRSCTRAFSGDSDRRHRRYPSFVR